MRKKIGKIIQCNLCKKKIYIPKWRLKRFKFCSKKCMYKSFLGKISPMKNKKHTLEALKKMTQTWFKKGFKPWNKGIFGYRTKPVNKKRKEKIRKAIKEAHKNGLFLYKNLPRGKWHHWWRGGASTFCEYLESSLEYKKWRKTVFARDNWTCQKCSHHGGEIDAHHLKPLSVLYQEFLQDYSQLDPTKDKKILLQLSRIYKPFWNTDNGITLCRKCHKKTETYGKKYFWNFNHTQR